MANCPKCNAEGLVWQKTASGKNWLKRDLGEGQVSKDWHSCDEKGRGNEAKVESNYDGKRRCADCKSILSTCNSWREVGEKSCQDCQYLECFCKTCMKHPNIMEVTD